MNINQDIKRLSNAEIARMSDTDLLDLRAGFGQMLGKLTQIQQTLRSNSERIKTELKHRREGGRMKGDFVVSDHAVIRYLERHKGVDVQAIREELREIARNAKFERDQKRKAGMFTHDDTGVRLVYSEDRNSIATVLSATTFELLSPEIHEGATPPIPVGTNE